MAWQRRFSRITAVSLYCLLAAVSAAYAGTPMTERIAVEAGVRAEVNKDLALPYSPQAELSGRTCLDGRPVR